MLGSLYGALPVTGTGQLSVPYQKPGGPSPSGSVQAAAAAWVTWAARTAWVAWTAPAGAAGQAAGAAPPASSSATHPPRARCHRVTSPPRSLGRFLPL